MTRFLLQLITSAAIGYTFGALLWLTPGDVAAGAIVAAAAVIVWGYLAWRDEQREKMRRGREQVWARRDREYR